MLNANAMKSSLFSCGVMFTGQTHLNKGNFPLIKRKKKKNSRKFGFAQYIVYLLIWNSLVKEEFIGTKESGNFASHP